MKKEENKILNHYLVKEVCSDNWSNRISKYWSFIGKCQPCYVLFGVTNKAEVILLKNEDPKTGDPVYGLLFDAKKNFNKIRNIIWHEAGHVFGIQTNNLIDREYYADKWSIESCMKRGYIKIVEEILLRCVDFAISDNDIYSKSSKKILIDFRRIVSERNILSKAMIKR